MSKHEIVVGKYFGSGEKKITLPDDFPLGDFHNEPVNEMNVEWPDTYSTRRDGQQLYVIRTDKPGLRWGAELIFRLKPQKECDDNVIEENTHKTIELSNEVCSYITINNQSSRSGLDFVKNNQNPNIIAINLELYKYCNNLTIDTDIEIHKDIYNNGVPNGLIYSLKQIKLSCIFAI